ncbi:hypothetical protein F4805DRAFT_454167 [Annulohypoxylon moriforme]|nr:hypothetical protein F4805DRAFT_454167 [Annulohypoxylon moriforme]
MQDSSCELHQSQSQSHSQFPSESQPSQHTESSFNPHNYDLEDWQRDVPQALLFPHSLDTAAPGRQVLLRHQRVILAPPTSPPSMTGTNEREAMDEKQGGTMRIKMERMKRWWLALKRRASPKLFPQAWLLFVIIILIAVGAVVTGWGGLAVETARHQTLSPPGPSATSAARPAPPNLEASASAITSSGLTWYNPTGYRTAKTVELTAWAPHETLKVTGQFVSNMPEDEISTHLTTHEHVVPTHEHMVKKDIITDYEITHITTVITDWVTSYVTALTVKTVSIHDSGPGWSVTTTPSTSSDSDVDTTITVTNSKSRMFCPDPKHPGAWTLCAAVTDHDATVLGAANTALTSPPMASSAHRSCVNPFTFMYAILNNVFSSAWNLLWNYDETRADMRRHIDRYHVLDLGCQCRDLGNLMLAMVDVIAVQQRMLEDKDLRIGDLEKVVESQKMVIEDQNVELGETMGVLGDVVRFVTDFKNGTLGCGEKAADTVNATFANVTNTTDTTSVMNAMNITNTTEVRRVGGFALMEHSSPD